MVIGAFVLLAVFIIIVSVCVKALGELSNHIGILINGDIEERYHIPTGNPSPYNSGFSNRHTTDELLYLALGRTESAKKEFEEKKENAARFAKDNPKYIKYLETLERIVKTFPSDVDPLYGFHHIDKDLTCALISSSEGYCERHILEEGIQFYDCPAQRIILKEILANYRKFNPNAKFAISAYKFRYMNEYWIGKDGNRRQYNIAVIPGSKAYYHWKYRHALKSL